MSRFAEVTHLEWIAAPIDRVRAQFADLKHHIHDNVRPKLSFKEIGNVGGAYRFEQCVKLLGIRQRDIFERSFAADGTMTDRSIEGFNKGGSVQIAFRPDSRADGGARRDGTEVSITVKLPPRPEPMPTSWPLHERKIDGARASTWRPCSRDSASRASTTRASAR